MCIRDSSWTKSKIKLLKSFWEDRKIVISVNAQMPKFCKIISTEFVPGSLLLGYHIAPVVMAYTKMEDGCSKVTIAQYDDSYVDMTKLKDLLNKEECKSYAVSDISELKSTWGGTNTIIGSPQVEGSTLFKHVVENLSLIHISEPTRPY